MHPVREASMLRVFGRLLRRRVDWKIRAPRDAVVSTEREAVERVETRLLTILELVNGWLQFAEAKNA
jgi:hypothetical protein